MALVKFGGGIVQMSGSIAGNVYARNRFGNYVRPRTKPVNPHSVRQEASRAIVSYLAEYWHQDLDTDQRNGWNVYAAAVAFQNTLGEVVYLTGFNHFIRTNSSILAIAQTLVADAPSILSLPEKDVSLVCSEESIALQEFTFTCETDGWTPNGDTKLAILLYQGQPKLASRNFFNGPWRLMDYIDATEGALGTGVYVAPFLFALGQKVWFKARMLTTSGRLSQAWHLDPRVIEADV